MVTIHKVEQGSDEWFALRKGRITASNAAALLLKGVNAALLKNNLDGINGGGSFWSNRGHTLEPEAIEIYEAVKGISVERAGFITNDRYPNAGYSPDGWEPMVEVKCFAPAKHLECLTEVPMEVYAQCQFGLMVAEKDVIDLLLYNPDIEDDKLCFKIVPIYRDEKLIERFERKLGHESQNQKPHQKSSAIL